MYHFVDTSWKFGLCVIVIYITKIGLESFYNLYRHPLKNFPGPRLAAASSWYKIYYEIYLERSWIHVLEDLHAKHGPIIRVGPNELDFSEPEAYIEIYHSSHRWDKQRELYHSLGVDRSSFGMLNHAQAKQRKDIIMPLFSKRAINDLQGLVWRKVNRLCEILAERDATGQSSDLFRGYRSFTLDTITTFCFAKCFDALEVPNFEAPMIEAMQATLPSGHIFKNFDLIRRIAVGMPQWLGAKITPQLAGLFEAQKSIWAQVDEVIRRPEILEDASHRTIYHELLSPEAQKGGSVAGPLDLNDEAMALIFAGTDTTGNVLMLGTFNLLSNPAMVRKLHDEVRAAWPYMNEAPSYEELEKLPYLTAVIKEALRTSPNVATPLPRVVPGRGATIRSADIPAHTVVGMSGMFVHNSEEIFKDATSFQPERWLQADSQALEKWLVPFSRGPRACIGPNLAYCELYLAFASIFRRFSVELDGTSASDLTWRECFVPEYNGRHLTAFCRPMQE